MSFQPRDLQQGDGSLAIPPVDLQPILNFTNGVLNFDLVSQINRIAQDLPSGGVPEMNSAISDFQMLAPVTKDNYQKLSQACKALKLRSAPMAVALCLELKQYARLAYSTYPTIFSNIKKLHLDTTNQKLRTSISQDLQNCQQLIDKNKAIAKFVFTNLGAYQETAKGTTPQILDAKKTLVNDDSTLLKVPSEGADAARDIAKFHGHIATLKSYMDFTLPEHPFGPDILHSIELMMGTWDAVANDLSGLSSKLDAGKLEDLNNILVNIDQKIVLKKWKALEDQSLQYINDNLSVVQDQIEDDLTDIKVRRQFEDNVLQNDEYFATPAT